MSKQIACDACGKNMTDDPGAGRLVFRREVRETDESGVETWPKEDVLVTVTATVGHDRHPRRDVCSGCVRVAVATGVAEDAGPVTR